MTPSGVRTPVVSMSMRALIGIVQALATPGQGERFVHPAGAVDQLLGALVVGPEAAQNVLQPSSAPNWNTSARVRAIARAA